MPTKISKLTLFAPPSRYVKVGESGNDKNFKPSFSWDNEDYRQNKVNKDGKDLAIPTEDDYVKIPIRHLSAGIVAGGTWRSTEFPEKILKKSASLLKHKPMYVNHAIEIGNNVGLVGDVVWVPSKKEVDKVIPGGLEAPAIIDSKLHTDLCRKLLAWPVPHIQSVSVTVIYEWEPSHEFKNAEGDYDWFEFDRHVGKIVKGKMVRRIATKIIDYIESSFVYLGADPYAKIKIGDDLFNIDWPSVVNPEAFETDSTRELYEKSGHYFVSLEKESWTSHISHNLNVEGLSKNTKTPIEPFKSSDQNISVMEKEILELLSKLTGVPQDEITPDVLKKYSFIKKTSFSSLPEIKGIDSNITGMESLKTAIEGVNARIEALEKDNKDKSEIIEVLTEKDAEGKSLPFTKTTAQELIDKANYGSKLVDSNKKECERLYKVSVGEGKEDPEIIKLINKSTPVEVVSLLKQYGGKAAEEFSIKIEEDGSHSFRQSTPEGGNGSGDEQSDQYQATYLGDYHL
ncbi:MAG: hypothetical protein CL843_09410 [Crocinitomicaceae bacterium]|nr:hypothetical protein [Crocinitomicaceae bacterium]|tara:strand:+ start:4777 stop:6315 length:1539 start_codon:yes stop_codon:yes gene_type:complete